MTGSAASQSIGEAPKSNEPIEISADTVEFDRELGVADFSGEVEVIQGTLLILSDLLSVHYDKAPDTGDASQALTGDITRIEANGNVSIVSDETEAAGDWAIYEISSDTVTLGGTVRLQSDGNILVGNRLTINTATGNTRLEAGSAAGAGRVRGVFKPTEDSDADPE